MSKPTDQVLAFCGTNGSFVPPNASRKELCPTRGGGVAGSKKGRKVVGRAPSDGAEARKISDRPGAWKALPQLPRILSHSTGSKLMPILGLKVWPASE